MEARSSSALFKRAEQLKRWQESDTARESAEPRWVGGGQDHAEETGRNLVEAAK